MLRNVMTDKINHFLRNTRAETHTCRYNLRRPIFSKEIDFVIKNFLSKTKQNLQAQMALMLNYFNHLNNIHLTQTLLVSRVGQKTSQFLLCEPKTNPEAKLLGHTIFN